MNQPYFKVAFQGEASRMAQMLRKSNILVEYPTLEGDTWMV